MTLRIVYMKVHIDMYFTLYNVTYIYNMYKVTFQYVSYFMDQLVFNLQNTNRSNEVRVPTGGALIRASHNLLTIYAHNFFHNLLHARQARTPTGGALLRALSHVEHHLDCHLSTIGLPCFFLCVFDFELKQEETWALNGSVRFDGWWVGFFFGLHL